MLLFFVILAVILLLGYLYIKYFRPPTLGTFVMVTGGVKSGKSTTSVGHSVLNYHLRVFAWKVRRFFVTKFTKKPFDIEMPLYYSNVPIKTKYGYVPITKELLLRQERFRYGSVIYFQEASFLAGSMDYGVESVDDALKELCKLIGHETKGGALYTDTQSVSDLHNSFRRSCSMELYIYKTRKVFLLPLLIVYYKQLFYNEDGQLVNVNTKNADDDLRRMILLKSTWKRFDCYCYSVLTDNLKVVDNVVYPKTANDFKANNILRLKDIIKKDKKESIINEKKNIFKHI